MRAWHAEPRKRARIEIIPMIDVMMFLLVFFVLVSINVIPAFGVKTQLPRSSNAETNIAKHTAIVSLGRLGETELDGSRISVPELTPALRKLQVGHPDMTVVINGDQSVELQRIIEVMDAVKAAGLQKISIAARKSATP